MKRPLIILFGAAIVLLFSNCTQNVLDQELTDYCECMQNIKTDDDIVQCREKIKVIAEKYEYDPEASEIIEKRLQECAAN